MKRVIENRKELEYDFSNRVTSNSFKINNFNEMKTTNNVQKAILKSLAVVVSFVLISFTVSAQGFWESLLENNTFNEIALAMVEINSETNTTSAYVSSSTNADAFASLLIEETEEALGLEDWMTNETNFSTTFTIEEEIESPMELEDWMKNESYFGGISISLEVETEEALEIENWMLETENFEVGKKCITGQNFIFVNIVDFELELESWMTDNKIWGN